MTATLLAKPDTFEPKTQAWGDGPVPPSRGGGRGRGRGPNGGKANGAPGKSKGLDYFDAPNFSSLFYHANGGDAQAAVSAVDLVALRAGLIARFGPRRSYYVLAANERRDRSARRRYVECCNWKFIEARHPSMANHDPADVWILEGILAATSQLALTGCRTIALVSHDGGFGDACRSYLNAGGRVVLVGFKGRFGLKLWRLRDHPRCKILDLRSDLRAVASVSAVQNYAGI